MRWRARGSGSAPSRPSTGRWSWTSRPCSGAAQIRSALARRAKILALWDEYETAATPEALPAEALDKLETVLQHTQGRNAPDFNYRFNLDYGRRYTADHPVMVELRRMLDDATERRARAAEGDG